MMALLAKFSDAMSSMDVNCVVKRVDCGAPRRRVDGVEDETRRRKRVSIRPRAPLSQQTVSDAVRMPGAAAPGR